MSEKRLPDGPGMWYSAAGEECYIFKGRCSGDWYVAFNNDYFDGDKSLGHYLEVCDINPGRWIKAEPPKFPELPPKPKLCFIQRAGITKPPGEWRVVHAGGIVGHPLDRGLSETSKYEVVPHPDNDPEAVRLIEDAHIPS